MASLTLRWLRQNAQPYLLPDRVFADIDAVLSRFSSLRPKTDVYTYDDGRTQLLLCLHGVLPITFRTVSYNIPMALWIPRDYPKLPPITYVVPTNDMLVKPSIYVDVSGRCNLEYLRNWERKSEGCNLITLLQIMQDHFSRDPPLFSKPKEQPTSPPRTASPSVHGRPALPPKPRPSPNLTSPDRASVNSLQYKSSSIPPPIPPLPPRTLQETSAQTNRPRSAQSVPSVIPYLYSSTPSTSPHGNDYHDSISDSNADIRGATTRAIYDHQDTTTPPVTSLIDEDAPIVQPIQQAPPRPPNPELLQLQARFYDKIESEMNALSHGLALDTERLRVVQTDLLAGEPAIRDEMARLEAVRDVCRNVCGRLHDTVNNAEKNVAELRRKGDPEIDEMVCATSIVHNQLINLVAEDNAIEDTIYQLHRALNAGRIDLERFLRTIRVLAEEQFMKRALIEKITIGIALNQSVGSHWS
ncbi:hypothetical protein APHAL10511_001209 [Amanita phalloides]|nr:hypothetical protein APHAL10511_001209 [Amanita phalloides]